MDIGIVIVSHNKPKYVWEAINSVLNQTHKNFKAILIDSGVLYDQGEFDRLVDSRFEIIRSDETDEIRRTKMVPQWLFNRLKTTLCEWPLVTYLCDDDLLLPEYFDRFVKARAASGGSCFYSSQRCQQRDGSTLLRLADRDRGLNTGQRLDCIVDYLQFCHTGEAMAEAYKVYGPELHPEGKEHYWHSDGIFMERMASLYTVKAIPGEPTSVNRRTPESVNIK